MVTAMIEIRADYIEAGKIPFPKWIPVSERELPRQDDTVLVTVGSGIMSYIDFGFCDSVHWWGVDGTEFPFPVAAWLPLPEPYRKETEDA